jgi:hypothetical protein
MKKFKGFIIPPPLVDAPRKGDLCDRVGCSGIVCMRCLYYPARMQNQKALIEFVLESAKKIYHA